MKKKFNFNVLSFVITVLIAFQLVFPIGIHAESSDGIGTVTVTVGDHTERPASVKNSKSTKYTNYKEPFGDIVSVKVPIAEGDSMYDSINKALATKGIKCNTTGKGSSVYIASIGPVTSQDGKRTVDKLGEFDGGPLSGWMGSLNDWYVNMGFGNWKVTDGDIIHMEYTCQGLGKDLGQWWDTSNPPDTSLKALEVKGGTLDKTFDKDVKEYTINVPAGTKSIQLNQTATNKANNAQIFVGDKSYKRFTDIPVSNGTNIEIYCGKSLKKDLTAANTTYKFTVKVQPAHVSDAEIDSVVNNLCNWYKKGNQNLLNSTFLQYVGSTAGDWLPLGAARYGIKDNYSGYLEAISEYVTKTYKEEDKLGYCKATEWERIALAVGAAGGDPTRIGKDEKGNPINLIADGTYSSIVNYDDQGLNAYVFGLIALDSRKYDVPEGSKYTRDDIIKGILSFQIACGGFQFGADGGAEGPADPDMTAMAVQALAPYYNDNKSYTYTIGEKEVTKTVKQVVDEALESIRPCQKEDGDFASWGTTNAESTDQVITALCALGIDPEKDERFITSSGKTPVNGIMKYVMKDGGIAHTIDTGSNGMATDQTLYTLAALKRERAGMNRLYDYSDVKYLVSKPVINVQPENETINAGEKLNLKVSAAIKDNGTLSYQWFKGGKEIDKATSAEYKIDTASDCDSGNYYVVVTNTLNDSSESVTSSTASVTVNKKEEVKPEKPVIKAQPEESAIEEGQKIALNVTAEISDNGTLSYEWYKDGKEIEGANSSTYSILNAGVSDSGNYYVVVTNTLNGAKVSVTSITVSVKVNKKVSDDSGKTQIYATDMDETTGKSTLELPFATIKGAGGSNLRINIITTPLSIIIPISEITADSKDTVKFEEQKVNISASLPEGIKALDSAFDVSLFVNSSNGKSTKISNFKKPVTFSFNVDKDKLSSYKLDTLKLYYFDGIKWQLVSDAGYDAATGIVTATTPHFSTFVLAGEKNEQVVNTENKNTSSESKSSASNDTKDEIKKLPQTGNFVNTEVMVYGGLFSIAIGSLIFLKRRDG